MRRLGSGIPPEADRLLPDGRRTPLPADCLPFSNGRAALAWVLCGSVHLQFNSALVCAYSCPSLVEFLRAQGLHVGFFDVGERYSGMMAIRRGMQSPCLVLSPPGIPSLDHPLTEPYPGDLVIVDAAQTAFGHLDYDGWVLSCPRKATSMLDGAILRFPGAEKYRSEVIRLPEAIQARTWNVLAQRFWAEGSDDVAWAMHRCGEDYWPATPHRMNEESLHWFERLDKLWHGQKRVENWIRMDSLINGKFPPPMSPSPHGCTPFSFTILVSNPKELVEHLKAQRIYASRLFHEAEHDPQKHKRTHILTRHLVSLPIDQRSEPHDIERIARAVLEVAKPMEDMKWQ